MDTLTHGLSGALLARVTAPVPGTAQQLTVRSRVAAGFLAALFPDSDIVIRFFSDPITYLNLHRGVTHSLLLLPVWALLLAVLCAGLWRRRYPWQTFYGVAALALAIHIAGDVITTYGTKIFAPLSEYKAIVPTTFIIDLYFTAIIAAGLLASWVWRASRLPALLSLALLVAYVGFQGVQMEKARALGEHHAQQQGWALAVVTALPQPLSPFNWKIIVQEGERYQVAHVNLWRAQALPEVAPEDGLLARIDAVHRPADDLHWQQHFKYGERGALAALAREAWAQPVLEGYRAFAEYPALYAVEENGVGTCAWFSDLRFAMDEVRNPFLFGACRPYSDAAWELYQLRDGQAVRL